MTYAELLKKLRDHHLYADLLTKAKKNDEVIECLEIKSFDVVAHIKTERVKQVVGDEFSVSYVEERGSIQIKKK